MHTYPVLYVTCQYHVCVSVAALTVVSLQLCSGSGLGRAHCALQTEEQQRSNVAGGGFTDDVREKGNLMVLDLVNSPKEFPHPISTHFSMSRT